MTKNRGNKGREKAQAEVEAEVKAQAEAESQVEVEAEAEAEAEVKAQTDNPTPDENHKGAVKIDRARYDATVGIKSATGRKTVNNGDPLANALVGKTHTDVIELVRQHAPEKVSDRWSTLNPGMARMSAGNVLRAHWKREGVVTIDGKKIHAPRLVGAEAA